MRRSGWETTSTIGSRLPPPADWGCLSRSMRTARIVSCDMRSRGVARGWGMSPSSLESRIGEASLNRATCAASSGMGQTGSPVGRKQCARLRMRLGPLDSCRKCTPRPIPGTSAESWTQSARIDHKRLLSSVLARPPCGGCGDMPADLAPGRRRRREFGSSCRHWERGRPARLSQDRRSILFNDG